MIDAVLFLPTKDRRLVEAEFFSDHGGGLAVVDLVDDHGPKLRRVGERHQIPYQVPCCQSHKPRSHSGAHILLTATGVSPHHRSQAIDRLTSGLYGANRHQRGAIISLHYTVVALTPNTDTWISDYMGAVPALVEKHGGRYIVQTPEYERIEGEGRETDPAMIVILEWPSKEAETAFVTDPDYAPHHKARLEGATNNSFSVPGVG